MVTVIDFKERKNSKGETFIALILQGDVELVQSQETGQFYATARRTSITSTFDANIAQMMIGKQLPGSIEKQACNEYEYTVKETGEVIKLSHTYVYNPKGGSTNHRPVGNQNLRNNMVYRTKKEVDFELPFAETPKPQFSMNGVHG